jgi:type IV pilus assembly protein PilM
MASSSACWGIEIGASAIRAIKLEATGDETVRVADYAVIPHAKPLSMPGVEPNDVLRVSLGALVSQADLSKAAIAVSIPGQNAFMRFAKLPPVEPKRVPQIVKFEAMQQIPSGLEEVEWDYQTFVAPDSPEVEVGIFAVKKEAVAQRLTLLQDVGLMPNVVSLGPIAVYNALAFDLDFNNDTPGTVIVDVGTMSTDLIVASPGRMWGRTFPIGGHQFTEALVNQFQLSYPKAEKLKREAEDSKHARQVLQTLRPVFTDLAQDIQRSIGYFQSLNKDVRLTRLIGVGETFRIPGLRKYLKQQLSLDVYRIEEFKKTPIANDRSEAFKDASLGMCTAYGLALQGLGMNAVQCNLMPVSVIRESMWKDKVKWFGVAAGLALAGSGAMFIRPLLDNFAIKARPMSPTVAQTLSQANSLKQDAEREGVVGAPEPDLGAANVLALGARRNVMSQIDADIRSMLAAGGMRDGGDPAYELAALNTSYVTGTAEAAGMADGGYGRDGRAAGGGGGFEERAGDVADANAFDRVLVRMVVRLDHPEPVRFVEDSIGRWLRSNANKRRDGVEYTIMISNPPFTVLRGAGATDAPPGAAPMPPSGSRPFGGRPDPRDRTPPPSRGSPSPGAATPDDAAKAAAIEGLAPLVKTGPVSDPSIATVTWVVVFKPANADEAEGGTQ